MTPEVQSTLPGTLPDPRYPDSDGKPMAETPLHVAAIIWLFQALQDLLARRSDVWLAANLFFYYERNKGGKRYRRVSPDVLVANGVGNHMRRSYRVWEEHVPPSVLFEISSKDTWRKDLHDKRALYARLKVAEYFLFDPESKYLDPPLQGFRLEKGVSVPIAPAADGSLLSVELGVRLLVEGGMLRLLRAKTGQPILTRAERVQQEKQRAQQEKQRAQQEKQRADALAAENAALQAELQRLRMGQA